MLRLSSRLVASVLSLMPVSELCCSIWLLIGSVDSVALPLAILIGCLCCPLPGGLGGEASHPGSPVHDGGSVRPATGGAAEPHGGARHGLHGKGESFLTHPCNGAAPRKTLASNPVFSGLSTAV